MKTKTLIEALDFSEAQVDGDASVIRNVVLIRAGMSANKRLYRPEVLAAAVPVFEGSKAYANHPNKAQIKEGRDIRDLTGWYSNVRFENNALRADRHFTPNQSGRDVYAIASLIAEGKAPSTLAGLSINAIGTGNTAKNEEGEFLDIESITHSQSVDDVASPAAGGGYRLTASAGDMLAALLEAMDYEDWFEARPEFRTRLQNEMKVIRQDDAIKAAQAEAKTLSETVTQLQNDLTEATQTRDAALAEAESVRREFAVYKLVSQSGIPRAWREALQAQLMKAAPDEWDSILETEHKKAQASKANRVPVTGSGVQVQPITPVNATESYLAKEYEDFAAWAKRTGQLREG